MLKIHVDVLALTVVPAVINSRGQALLQSVIYVYPLLNLFYPMFKMLITLINQFSKRPSFGYGVLGDLFLQYLPHLHKQYRFSWSYKYISSEY